MMEQEIKDIIAKNLPAHVGEVLQKRLAEAETDRSERKRLIAALEEQIKENSRLGDVIKQYQKDDQRNRELSIREAAVETAERNLKIVTLEGQLAAEKDKAQFVKDVSMGLVRNIEYRKMVFGNENVPHTYQGGGTYYENKPYDKTEDNQAI